MLIPHVFVVISRSSRCGCHLGLVAVGLLLPLRCLGFSLSLVFFPFSVFSLSFPFSCCGGLLQLRAFIAKRSLGHRMPRGERGGKKTKASKDRAREVAEGLREPGKAPSSISGIERVSKAEGAVALESSSSKAPSITYPKITTEARSVPRVILTTSTRTVPKLNVPVPKAVSGDRSAPKTPPKAPPKASQPVLAKEPVAKATPIASPKVSSAPTVASVVGTSTDPVPIGELAIVPYGNLSRPPAKRGREPVEGGLGSEASSSSGVVVKAKVPPVKLSEPIGSTELRPNPRDIASTAPVIGPGQELKIRLSCDLHGCLDFGSLTEGVWSTESRSSLVNWLTSSQYHQVGVCTYIGLKGLDSQKRRNNAVSEVHRFNQDYHTNLRILITTDREKHVLSPEHVSCHIDDKPNLCELIHERGLPVVCLNLAYKQRLGRHYQPPPPFPVVANFQEAIAAVRNFRLVPRAFKVWPGIFRTA